LGSETTAFYLLGSVAVAASLLVVGQRNPIYSVLLLITSLGALSGLYVLLDAPLIAVIQIIVYAGAILVLFLFVVMLLNASHEETVWAVTRAGGVGRGAFAPVGVSSVRAIGIVLFTDYAFAFEVTALLVLVALVGAVVLARRDPVSPGANRCHR
jgi:NADH-quinone oxidoreductase subunit J